MSSIALSASMLLAAALIFIFSQEDKDSKDISNFLVRKTTALVSKIGGNPTLPGHLQQMAKEISNSTEVMQYKISRIAVVALDATDSAIVDEFVELFEVNDNGNLELQIEYFAQDESLIILVALQNRKTKNRISEFSETISLSLVNQTVDKKKPR